MAPLPTAVDLANDNSNQLTLAHSSEVLRKPLTSLTMRPYRDETGKNFTQRTHILEVPMSEAMQSRSMLTAMLSPASSQAELGVLIKPLAARPAQASTEDASGKAYMVLLQGQPRLSIQHAVDRVLREPVETFRPTPGQFLRLVTDHAKTVELKLAHLNEAIAAHHTTTEKGQGA